MALSSPARPAPGAPVAAGRRAARSTGLRQAILAVLQEAGIPLTAYGLIPRLEVRLGRSLRPPTIYRALEFMMARRIVTRIESRNAYFPCAHPGRPHACVFLLCHSCGRAVEVEDTDLERRLSTNASAVGFRVARHVHELEGICACCVDGEPSAKGGRDG